MAFLAKGMNLISICIGAYKLAYKEFCEIESDLNERIR